MFCTKNQKVDHQGLVLTHNMQSPLNMWRSSATEVEQARVKSLSQSWGKCERGRFQGENWAARVQFLCLTPPGMGLGSAKRRGNDVVSICFHGTYCTGQKAGHLVGHFMISVICQVLMYRVWAWMTTRPGSPQTKSCTAVVQLVLSWLGLAWLVWNKV